MFHFILIRLNWYCEFFISIICICLNYDIATQRLIWVCCVLYFKRHLLKLIWMFLQHPHDARRLTTKLKLIQFIQIVISGVFLQDVCMALLCTLYFNCYTLRNVWRVTNSLIAHVRFLIRIYMVHLFCGFYLSRLVIYAWDGSIFIHESTKL